MRARVLLALATLLLPALAGCLAGEAPAAEAPPLPALGLPDPPRFLEAVAMDQPSSGAEPNLAVLPDGTLFLTAVAGSQERPNALEGAAWLWRSKDGGATWETLRAPVRETPLGSIQGTRRPFGSSDADVVTSPDGWVYYSDWWLAGAPVAGTERVGNYLVERSGDGGDTWERTPVTIRSTGGDVDRQWLVAGPDGFLGLFYANFHQVENTATSATGEAFIATIDAVFSTDHGASFGAPVTVVPAQPGHFYQIAHPALMPDGTLVMPYGDILEEEDFWTDPSEVRLAVSEDEGRTWESRLVAPVPEGFDNLWAVQGAADEAGNLFVAWAARSGGNMTLFLGRSPDAGATWSEPVAVRAEGLNFLPWVAARNDSHVAVAWYGGNATGDPAEAPPEAEWFAYVAESRGPGAPFAVARVSDVPVKLGPLCPRGAACPGDRELLDYANVAFDPAGRLHAAFARSRDLDGVEIGHVHYAGAIPADADG